MSCVSISNKNMGADVTLFHHLNYSLSLTVDCCLLIVVAFKKFWGFWWQRMIWIKDENKNP